MNKFPSAILLAATLTVVIPMALSQAPPDINESFAKLADQPATHTAFTFDRSMLQIAQNLLASNGMDANHAAAALPETAPPAEPGSLAA